MDSVAASEAHPKLQNDIMDEKEKPQLQQAGYAMVNGTIIIALPASNTHVPGKTLGTITLDFDQMNTIDSKDIVQLASDKTVPVDTSGSLVLQQTKAELTVELELERDDTYYLPMLLVETADDVQFLVPQHRFPESATGPLIHARDQDETSVISLDVSSEDFRGFMELIYPLNELGLQTQHWISVLKLSTTWMTLPYRKQAITSLEGFLSPEELVELGRAHGVPTWFRRGCIAFARADVHLDSCHEETLGIETMVKITHARDKALSSDMRLYHQRLSTNYPRNDILFKFFDPVEDEDSADSNIVQRILSAREANSYDALRYCYSQLIDREESISFAEAVSLELDTAVMLWKARYELQCKYRQILSTLHDSVGFRSPLDFAACIEQEFAEEFEVAESLYDLLDPSPPRHLSPPPSDFEVRPAPEFEPEPTEPGPSWGGGAKKKKKKKK